MTMMTLYYGLTSPFARKVRIAVAERGLGNLVREVAVTVRTPKNLVLGVNPTGKVPCLVVEDGPEKGLVFLESSLICEYLEEHGDAPPLLPPSGPERWRERAFDAYAHALLDSIAWRTREFRKPDEYQYGPFIEYEAERIERCLNDLEGQADMLPGAPLSLGRILLACALDYMLLRFPDWEWRQTYQGLSDWHAAMVQRPSFQATSF